MGIIKDIALGIAGVAVVGTATVVAVPELRNKAMDKIAEQSNQYQQVIVENEELRTENDEKAQTIIRINAEIETERANVRNIQLRLDAANASLTQANTDKATLQTQLNTANADKAALQTRLDAKIAELENSQTELSAKETEITTLTAQIAELQAELAEMDTLQLGKYVWSYQLENGDYEDVYIEVLENSVAKYYIDAENFVLCTYSVEDDKINVTFEEDNQEVNIQFTITSSKTFETNDLGEEMQFVYCTDELLEVLETRQAAQADKHAMQANIQNMSAELINIQNQLESANAEVTRMQSELDAKQTRITELNATIQELSMDKLELEARITELENSTYTVDKSLRDYCIFIKNASNTSVPINSYWEINFDCLAELKNLGIQSVHEEYRNYISLPNEDIYTEVMTSNEVTHDESSSVAELPCNQTIEFVDKDGNVISSEVLENYTGVNVYYKLHELSYENYTEQEVAELCGYGMNNVTKSITLKIEVIEKYDYNSVLNNSYVNGRTVVMPRSMYNDWAVNTFIYTCRVSTEDGAQILQKLITIVGDDIMIDNVLYKRVYSASVESELVSALESDKAVELTADIELTQTIEVTKDTTINLAGKYITGANTDGAVFRVSNGATLTIYGDGYVAGGSGADCRAVEVLDGTLNIYDGTYTVGPDAQNAGNSTIYANANGATINIYGGMFSSDAAWNDFYYVLNVKNDVQASVNVYGGIFKGYNPATGDDRLGGNFVAEGKKSVAAGEYFVIIDEDAELNLYDVEGTTFRGLSDIGLALYKAGVYTDIVIPEGVETIVSGALLGKNCFSTVYIPKTVTSIAGNSFARNSTLTNIIVDEENDNYVSVDGVLYTKDMTTLVCYPSGKSGTTFVVPEGVTTISQQAVRETQLEEIVLPETLQAIESPFMYNDSQLRTVTIKSNSVVSLGWGAFLNSENLEAIYVKAELVEDYKAASNWSKYAGIIQAIPEVE